MRAYQQKFENSGATADGRLSAEEDSTRFYELDKAITTAGITPDPYGGPDTDKQQLAQAMARYASRGVFGTGSGTGNANVVTAIGTAQPPKAVFDGMRVMWYANGTNTTAATVNPFGLGVKTIRDETNTVLVGGEIVSGRLVEVIWSDGNNCFLLAPWSNQRKNKHPAFSAIIGLVASQTTFNVASDPNSVLCTSYSSTTNTLSSGSTFASGVLTIGALDAGWYNVGLTLDTNLTRPGDGGTADPYGVTLAVDLDTGGGYVSKIGITGVWSSSTHKGPFFSAGGLLYLGSGHKIVAGVGQNSGVAQNCPITFYAVRVGV